MFWQEMLCDGGNVAATFMLRSMRMSELIGGSLVGVYELGCKRADS